MITNCKNGGGILRNTNKKKGFTLIELLAVIVILAIIALIATPIILNMINDAKKSAAVDSAYGYIKAIENKVALSALQDKTYEDKVGYAYNEIEVDIKGIRPTGGLYTLKSGVVTNGTFCIDGYTVNYENNKAEIVNKGCNEEDLKLNGSIKLSSNSGSYTYPESKEVEVIENISGGTLSCKTNDSSVATCTISGNIITVKSGTKEGNATLTIISEATSKYKEAQVAYVAITAKGTLTSYTANGYSGTYDGNSHGITVTSENTIIKYGEKEGTYNLDESPKYSDAGTYTVYYQITKAGYKTVTGSKDVVITKAEGSVTLSSTSGTVAYKETKKVEIVENVSNGEIEVEIANPEVAEVSIENNKVVIKGKQIGTATLTITSKETKNYNSSSTQYQVEVIKANNTLTLSANTATYTYPTSGTFTVTTNTSGGTLSCTTSNSAVATCEVSGTTVTVNPAITSGISTKSVNITITSAATTNYNATTVTHVATVQKNAYLLGELVYFDPVSDTTCNENTFTGTNTCYKWRVIETNDSPSNSNILLQMDHNLINEIAWASSYNDINDKLVYLPIGPLTTLNSFTSNWNRVPNLNYEYDSSDASGVSGNISSTYGKLSCVNGTCTLNLEGTSITISGTAKARMITGEEVVKIIKTQVPTVTWTLASPYSNWFYFSEKDAILGTNNYGNETGNTNLSWLIENTSNYNSSGATSNVYGNGYPYGYWTLSPTSNDFACAWFVYYLGSFNNLLKYNSNYNGVRPVINIPKSYIK